jgi:hypothetical protein
MSTKECKVDTGVSALSSERVRLHRTNIDLRKRGCVRGR